MASHDTEENIGFRRPLYLPGIVVKPGDLVIIVDTRGRTIKGVFMGYSSKFIALADECENKPSRFINIQKVLEITILKSAYCSEESK